MRKTAVYGTSAVVLATAINLTHAVSHAGQNDFSLEAWQWVYVMWSSTWPRSSPRSCSGPPLRLAGAWLLLGSMAGSLAFKFAYHFLIPGPDNVFTLEPGAWLAPFWVSTVLLVAASGLGALVGGWAVLRLQRPEASAPPGGPVVIERGQG